VIFFSSISSSAKFFWYFSQLEPVALGILDGAGGCVADSLSREGRTVWLRSDGECL
jgi:hypothetical protein